jgi:hypothetical protein
MTASGPPPNQLLQLLDAPAFDLLRPHLATIEMVRKSVLGEAGTALRCRRECSLPGTIIETDILSQLPTYPDGNMMEPTRAGRDFAYRDIINHAGNGRQLWKRWCARPMVSCPRCRQTIMN